jgi:hypothetical protein
VVSVFRLEKAQGQLVLPGLAVASTKLVAFSGHSKQVSRIAANEVKAGGAQSRKPSKLTAIGSVCSINTNQYQ